MLRPCAKNRNSRLNKAACDRFPSIQTTTARSEFGIEQLKVHRNIDSLSSTYASLSHVHRPSVLVDAIAPFRQPRSTRNRGSWRPSDMVTRLEKHHRLN